MTETGVIDFTMHLAGERSLNDATDLTRIDPHGRLEKLASEAQAAGIVAGNVMLLDTDLFRRGDNGLVTAILERGLTATAMVDPRDEDAAALLERAAESGCRGLKFHPYLLGLGTSDFPEAIALARHAERLGMWVAVCCSYGTIRVHDISGPRLVAALVRAGITAPVIALHAGGAAVLDVMSIALDAPTVLMETSFSIPYWNGSSVEQDLAFAMRKVGPDRCLYGSDHPHVKIHEAPDHLRRFMELHGFDDADIAKVLTRTARRILSI